MKNKGTAGVAPSQLLIFGCFWKNKNASGDCFMCEISQARSSLSSCLPVFFFFEPPDEKTCSVTCFCGQLYLSPFWENIRCCCFSQWAFISLLVEIPKIKFAIEAESPFGKNR